MAEPPGPSVAITVDAEHPDRPRCTPGNCERLLEALQRAGVQATFFLQGRWVSAYPGLARRIATEGHLIGNHSHYHARMPLLSPRGWEEDVSHAERAIREVVGVDPRPYFRSPFGAGLDHPELTEALVRLGYRNFGWDVDGADWEQERSTEEVEEALLAGALAGTGTRVLLVHSWSDQAAGALPGVLARLKERGANFLTLQPAA